MCYDRFDITIIMVRPAFPIKYTDAVYDGKPYTIGRVKFKDTFVHFIIDSVEKERVCGKHWFVVARQYIGYYVNDGGKRKTICLHNLILDNERDRNITVDHINGIGFDNRRCNLREASLSLQMRNTRQRNRRITHLPDGILHEDLPRNVWFMPANGSHGDRFVVEFTGASDIGNIEVKTTASRFVSARTKLDEAIRIRNNLLEQYPCLVEYSRASEISERLHNEYNIIISLAI